MNNTRRKEIQDVLNELADLRSQIDTLHGEEQEAYDNMPESLQQSERGQAAENAASELENALSAFDEIASSLNAATA